jgi:predicted AlkP superfamily pyrophosphatase or phosphodiesterase
LVEAGVRFVEVSLNLNFPQRHRLGCPQQRYRKPTWLIRELDVALSTLIQDLEKKKLFDKTLIVVATEFGRPRSSLATVVADIRAVPSRWF